MPEISDDCSEAGQRVHEGDAMRDPVRITSILSPTPECQISQQETLEIWHRAKILTCGNGHTFVALTEHLELGCPVCVQREIQDLNTRPFGCWLVRQKYRLLDWLDRKGLSDDD